MGVNAQVRGAREQIAKRDERISDLEARVAGLSDACEALERLLDTQRNKAILAEQTAMDITKELEPVVLAAFAVVGRNQETGRMMAPRFVGAGYARVPVVDFERLEQAVSKLIDNIRDDMKARGIA